MLTDPTRFAQSFLYIFLFLSLCLPLRVCHLRRKWAVWSLKRKPLIWTPGVTSICFWLWWNSSMQIPNWCYMWVKRLSFLWLYKDMLLFCTINVTCVFVNQNPGKQGLEVHSSTADLITGLVQLVPLANMGDISQEAMEVRSLYLTVNLVPLAWV